VPAGHQLLVGPDESLYLWCHGSRAQLVRAAWICAALRLPLIARPRRVRDVRPRAMGRPGRPPRVRAGRARGGRARTRGAPLRLGAVWAGMRPAGLVRGPGPLLGGSTGVAGAAVSGRAASAATTRRSPAGTAGRPSTSILRRYPLGAAGPRMVWRPPRCRPIGACPPARTSVAG
jgi:hypothetical protein